MSKRDSLAKVKMTIPEMAQNGDREKTDVRYVEKEKVLYRAFRELVDYQKAL